MYIWDSFEIIYGWGIREIYSVFYSFWYSITLRFADTLVHFDPAELLGWWTFHLIKIIDLKVFETETMPT